MWFQYSTPWFFPLSPIAELVGGMACAGITTFPDSSGSAIPSEALLEMITKQLESINSPEVGSRSLCSAHGSFTLSKPPDRAFCEDFIPFRPP